MEPRYWDSSAFLGWLKEEGDKAGTCRQVLQEAKAGRILLVTSALTLVEVIKLQKHSPIGIEDADKIKEFFKHSYISVRNVDRYIAETARDLVWRHSALKPKDAIHVATAVRLHLPVLETFDDDLIALSQTIGQPPLCIRRPSVAQLGLPFAGEETEVNSGTGSPPSSVAGA